jgi:hypothetical protein
VGRRNVHSDDFAIHRVQIRCRNMVVLQLHRTLKRATLRVVSSIS